MPFDFQPSPEDPDSLRRSLSGLATMALAGLLVIGLILLLVI